MSRRDALVTENRCCETVEPRGVWNGTVLRIADRSTTALVMSDPAQTERARREFEEFLERTRTGDAEPLDEFLRDRTWISEVLGGTDFQAAVLDSVLAELDRRDAGAQAAPDAATQFAPDADRAKAESYLGGGLGRFGRFELREVLGSGGMGSVFLAYDTVLEREVALKRVRPELLVHEDVRTRFDVEARALSAVDHPNLCRLYDVGECDGIPFLVMHREQGETLATRIGRVRTASEGSSSLHMSSRDSISEVALIVEKIARALHHAHEAGLVHRDVKPGNIIVRDDGEPVLIDFGLVREEDTELGLTATGAAPGTRPYMSPEQIRADDQPLDRRTDVYSLGVVLYECLALEHPFTASSVHEYGERILAGDTVPIGRVNSRIPRDLRVVVETAMNLDRKDRYPTAAALADDLAAIRTFQPIRARPAGVLRRTQRWCQRHPARAAFLALLVVSLAVVLVLWLESAARLSRFETAAQSTTLARLRAEESVLYPVWKNEERAHQWLARARALLAERPALKGALDELRASAVPLSAEALAVERATHPKSGELARVRRDIDVRRAELASMVDGEQVEATRKHATQLREQVKMLEERAGVLEAEVGERRMFRQRDPLDDLEGAVLARLVAELGRFQKGAFARVTREFESVPEERSVSVDDSANAWTRVIADVESDDRYAGLELAPQFGLVPLAKHSDTGLWEFWHVRSGKRPELDESTGRWKVDGESGIVFVLLPGGEFDMGAQGDDPSAANYWRAPAGTAKLRLVPFSWEGPVRRMRVEPLFISKYEMTQGQWKRLTGGANPSIYPEGDVHPVEGISWTQSSIVLDRFGLRLPSEMQWEYACRAGRQTAWWMGDTIETTDGMMNIADRDLRKRLTRAWDHRSISDGFAMHAPVGSFPANPFGLHEVHGNVSEWCVDFATDFGPDYRWLRGGSYFNVPWTARCSARNYSDRNTAAEDWGVRPVRPMQLEP